MITKERLIEIIKVEIAEQRRASDGILYVRVYDDETEIGIDGTIDLAPIADAILKELQP